MTPFDRLARPLLGALCALTLSGAPTAQAVGRWADIQVIDRDSGETLPLYHHKGDLWVAGRPGARYAVAVRNTSGERVMTVVSVDGVNVISGETASWEQTGYVFNPWQAHDITGWRKSDDDVAAFHFTALSDAYATRTGRPDNVGVIGVAVFREKAAPPAVATPLPAPRPDWRNRRELSEAERADLEKRAPASPSAAAPTAEMGASGRSSAQRAPQRLGTGHGEREAAPVGHTRFERRSDRPDELIRIRYDSRDNLVAQGVIPRDTWRRPPQPFPGAARPTRYVPDPR